MIFFGIVPGIIFLMLGLFLVLTGLWRTRDRPRLLIAGFGAILVGIGNFLTVQSMFAGLVLIAGGFVVILNARRARGA